MTVLNSILDVSSKGHLTIQHTSIGKDTLVLRSLDWDRKRFDIEFDLKNGTTYNSFIIQGDKTALIDTSHQKFREQYLTTVKEIINLQKLDYLIVNHTEPDHSGLVKDILNLAPQVTIIGSKVAIQYLENMVNQPFTSQIVKNGDQLDLGNGHLLEFVAAPNLHWPDTMFTYDHATGILFTCDVFGMHYCNDLLWDEYPNHLLPDFRYYYDCLMGPNARAVLGALKRIEHLTINVIATGHGPLLHHHLTQWMSDYQKWSQEQTKASIFAAIFYVEGYGHSEDIARSIGQGLSRGGVDVELVNMLETDVHIVRELVSEARGLIIGMPPQSASIPQTILSTILATANVKQRLLLFESGGGEDEPIFPFRNRCQEIGLREVSAPILVKEAWTESLQQICEENGSHLGELLTRAQTLKQIKSLDNDLEKALGRLSNGIYAITLRKGELNHAMIASWVMQSSFAPPGVAVAIAKERALAPLLSVGTRFVVNVFEESNYQGIMRQLLKRTVSGNDQLAGIKTYPASDETPIFADALAYMECEVSSRLECSDHWIVYGEVKKGRVSKAEALTAVHHRKVGNHY